MLMHGDFVDTVACVPQPRHTASRQGKIAHAYLHDTSAETNLKLPFCVSNMNSLLECTWPTTWPATVLIDNHCCVRCSTDYIGHPLSVIIPTYLQRAATIWARKVGNQVTNYRQALAAALLAKEGAAPKPASNILAPSKSREELDEAPVSGDGASSAADPAAANAPTTAASTAPVSASTPATAAPPAVAPKKLTALQTKAAQRLAVAAQKPPATSASGRKAANLIAEMREQQLAGTSEGLVTPTAAAGKQSRKRKVPAKQQEANDQSESEKVRKSESKTKRDAATHAAFEKANKPPPTVQGV